MTSVMADMPSLEARKKRVAQKARDRFASAHGVSRTPVDMARALLRLIAMTMAQEFSSTFVDAARGDDGRADRDLAAWFRWGWAPLVGGCLALALLVTAGWEILLAVAGIEPGERGHQWWFLARGAAMSALIAAWTGWYVLAARRRLEAAKERLRSREAALAEQLRKAERQVGLAALTRGLAHELRTPLNGLVLNCTLLRRTVAKLDASQSSQFAEILAMMEGEIERLSNLVTDYVAWGKAAAISPVLEKVDMLELAREVLQPWQDTLGKKGIAVRMLSRGPCEPASVDPSRMKQALDQIIRNAVEVMPSGGAIEVACIREKGRTAIDISDDGPGFDSPEAAFRPFFTTKSAGSGLGLAIVRDIVRAHGGEVFARNRTGKKGASITIRLPLRGA